MKQKKISVEISYERSVRVGAQQALLRDIFNDVGRLRADTAFGNAYRKVYSGAQSKFDPEDVKKLLKDGQTILLTEEASESALKTAGSALAGVNLRTLTPQNLADLLNNKALSNADEEKNLPLDAQGNQRPFEAGDVTLNASGQWKSIDPKTGRTAQPYVQRVLGGTPVQMTPADLKKLEQINSDAAVLGVTASDLLKMSVVNVSGATVAKDGKIMVWWNGSDVQDSTKMLEGSADTLRGDAPRPGGVNYKGTPWVRPQYQEPTSDMEERPVMSVEESLDRNVHNPAANLQKKDNYAVLRVVSGFTASAGDILAPANNSGKFKVEFATNKFLLESVQEPQSERISMVETFGETILYSYGERPKVYSYTGVLMDTQGLNWLNEWREAYKTRFRATAMLKLKARAFLIYRDVCREGIIIANVNTLNVAEMGMGRFSFQMFVMREYYVDARPRVDDQTDSPSGLDVERSSDEEEPQYELVTPMTDKTQDPSVSPDAPDGQPLARVMKAAIAAETAIIEKRRGQIESNIKEQSGLGSGKYTQSSGVVDLKLVAEDASIGTAAYNKRLEDESFDPSKQGRLTGVTQ